MAITPVSSSFLSLQLPSLAIPKRCYTRTQLVASLSCSNNSAHSYPPYHHHTVADRALLAIQNSGIIACLRAHSAELALEAARAALSGGITVLEIVISTPGVYEVLQQLVLDYPTATLGVGTVLDAKDAKEAIKCGVKFLMSPAIVMDILEDVSDNEALYIPGAMTPTEILSAFNTGAKIVKIYPVSALGGVEYVAALRKPFSHIPMVASQGIKIGEYIARGATAVVLSDAIFEMGAMHDRNYVAIHQLATRASFLGSEAVKRLELRLSGVRLKEDGFRDEKLQPVHPSEGSCILQHATEGSLLTMLISLTKIRASTENSYSSHVFAPAGICNQLEIVKGVVV